MKKMRRVIGLLLAAMMVLSVFGVSAAEFGGGVSLGEILRLFRDVPDTHMQYDSIHELEELGYVIGVGDELFKPDDMTTRAEFIKMLVFAVGKDEETAYKNIFSDVPQEHWAAKYIMRAVEIGIIDLNELPAEAFQPDAFVDKETAALWITRGMGITREVECTTEDAGQIVQQEAVATVLDLGVMTADANIFSPDKTFMRSDAAVIIKRVMDKYQALQFVGEEKEEVVYQDDVITLETAEDRNVVVENTDEYIKIAQADEAVAELKSGAVFLVAPCDVIPYGAAVKVKNIQIDGGQATIYKDEIAIGEVAKHIDIANRQSVTAEDLQLEDGFSFIEGENSKVAAAGALSDSRLGGASGVGVSYANTERGTGAVEITETPSMRIAVNKEINDMVTITGNISLSLGIETKFAYEEFWSGPIIHLAAVEGIESELKVTAGGNAGGDSMEFLLAPGFTMPIGPTGAYVEGDIYLSVDMQGEVSIKFEQTRKTGFHLENWKVDKINENLGGDGLTPDVSAKVSAYIGPKLDLSLEWMEVVGVGMKVGIAGGVEAALETRPHDALFCINGPVNLKFTVEFYLQLKVPFGLSFDPSVKPVDLKIKLGRFYIHRANGADYGEFGWGDCPYLHTGTPPEDLSGQDDIDGINGAGNYSSGNFATSDGKYVYYSEEEALWREDLDGSNKMKITDGTFEYIIVNGETIYASELNFSVGRLKAIENKENGNKKSIFDYEQSSGIGIYDGYLYFEYAHSIPIMRKQIGRIQLNDNSGTVEELAECMAVAGIFDDCLYYFTAEDCLNIMNLNTGEVRQVLGHFSSLNVVGHKIYYKYGEEIWSMDLDGTNQVLLYKGNQIGAINVAGDSIYYTCVRNGNWEIDRMNTDGSGQEIVHNDFVYQLCIVNGKFYGRDSEDFSKVKIETPMRLEDIQFEQLFKGLSGEIRVELPGSAPVIFAEKDYNDIQYHDLDGNGTDEILLVYNKDSAGAFKIYAANGTAVEEKACYTGGGKLSNYTLVTDGSRYYIKAISEVSGGAYYRIFAFDGSAFSEIAAYSRDHGVYTVNGQETDQAAYQAIASQYEQQTLISTNLSSYPLG